MINRTAFADLDLPEATGVFPGSPGRGAIMRGRSPTISERHEACVVELAPNENLEHLMNWIVGILLLIAVAVLIVLQIHAPL